MSVDNLIRQKAIVKGSNGNLIINADYLQRILIISAACENEQAVNGQQPLEPISVSTKLDICQRIQRLTWRNNINNLDGSPNTFPLTQRHHWFERLDRVRLLEQTDMLFQRDEPMCLQSHDRISNRLQLLELLRYRH